jgi:hypothetical protein
MARGTAAAERPAERSGGRSERLRPDPSTKITLSVTDIQLFLGKSKRAFYLLRRDPKERFPAPFVVQGRDHWLMRDLLDWIESRRRRDAIPGRTALSYGDRRENFWISEP